MEWTRELDLTLVAAVKRSLGPNVNVWRSDESPNICWESIFKSEKWPSNFHSSSLKDRWQENHRKWVPREPARRATVVDFTVLNEVIQTRSYSGRKSTARAAINVFNVQTQSRVAPPAADSSEEPRPHVEFQPPEPPSIDMPLYDSYTNVFAMAPPQTVDPRFLTQPLALAPPHVRARSVGLSDSSSPLYTRPAASDTTVEDLVATIDWSSEREPKVRRMRGPSALSAEKHVQQEAERRSAMSDAIANLGSSLPPAITPAHPTQLNVLNTAAEYFQRVKYLSSFLLEENKRLRAELQAREPLPPPVNIPILRSEAARLLLVSVFVIFAFVSSIYDPTSAFYSSSIYHLATSRRVLEAATHGSLSPLSSWPYQWLAKLIALFCVFLCIYIAVLLQDMPRIPEDRLVTARRLVTELDSSLQRGLPRWRETQEAHQLLMHALGKSVPSTTLGEVLFLGMQVTRTLMHRVYVGLIVERYLVYHMKREEASALEATAYLVGSLLQTGGSFMCIPACMLASIAAAKVTPLPVAHWPNNRPPVFPIQKKRNFPMLFAVSLLAPLRRSPDVASEVTILEPLMSGRLKECLNKMRIGLPQLLSHSRETGVRVLSIGGMLLFCLRRFDECFALHTTLTTMLSELPPANVRFLAVSLVFDLVMLGRATDARSVFTSLEELYKICQDDSLMMPPDILLRNAAKAVLADDNDILFIISCISEIVRVAQLLPLVPFFHLPCMLEVIASRLLLKLEPNTSDDNFLIKTNRRLIEQILDQLIEVIAKFVQWPLILEPVLHRLRGWRAHTRGDEVAARYHLNLSLRLAEGSTDAPMSRQIDSTLALMERLAVQVLYTPRGFYEDLHQVETV